MKLSYVIEKSRRKSVSIHITDEKKILVKAPLGMTESEIRKIIVEKEEWIKKHLQKAERQRKLAQELGLLTEEDIKELKKKAAKIIPPRVEHYARLAGISYNRIFIRLQKSRWGSCSSSGNLNFNCLLILMPPEILDSVVVHELCHRRHMNHSREFYAEVLKFFPDYKRCDKWLRQNGNSYLLRCP